MAPRGAPSPGRPRPPISPAPSPACPARLRLGALRWGRRTRGPAGRLLVICPCFPLSGRPQDDGVAQFSLCPAGRAEAGPPRDPSLSKGARASEPRASASRSRSDLAPECHLLQLPPSSPAAAPAGPSASLRKASGRSAAANRPGVRPSAARGERVRRSGPRAGERRGEGEGKEKGRGRSVAGLGAASTAASPPPSPLLPQLAPPPPQSAPPPAPRGSLGGATISVVGAQPRPHPLWLGVLPPKLSLASSQSSSPETAAYPCTPRAPRPSPQTPALNSLPQFGQRAAPLFVPGPGHGWWVGAGGQGEGRSAVLGWGRGRVTEATPGVCSVRARSERRAPGEQVPVARRAHERASEQRP